MLSRNPETQENVTHTTHPQMQISPCPHITKNKKIAHKKHEEMFKIRNWESFYFVSRDIKVLVEVRTVACRRLIPAETICADMTIPIV